MNYVNRSQAKQLTGISYLSGVNTSAKLSHSEQYSNMDTLILYLAAASISGYNVCPGSTAECREGCLENSGRVRLEADCGKSTIKDCRVKRTILLMEHQQFFMNWLCDELESAMAAAKRRGHFFSVRLNGTSDIDWSLIPCKGKANIFEAYPDVQFYDYTKLVARFNNMPANYHLTFSYTGHVNNIESCKKLLAQGKNIAVVFNSKNFPASFLGCPVINGDLTDYRVNDGTGVVVGLKFKHIADRAAEAKILKSRFVVSC